MAFFGMTRRVISCFLSPTWLLVALLSPCVAMAQDIVQGKVLNKQDNTPIPYANVWVRADSTGAATDEEGLFAISGRYVSLRMGYFEYRV